MLFLISRISSSTPRIFWGTCNTDIKTIEILTLVVQIKVFWYYIGWCWVISRDCLKAFSVHYIFGNMKYLSCTQIFASRINQIFADEIWCVSLVEINSPKCFRREYFWQFSFRKAIRAIVQGMIFNFPKKKKVKGESCTKRK